MATYTTYVARPVMAYLQPGYQDAAAAADAINKKLCDADEATFEIGDALAERTAERAMQREIDSCHHEIRATLMVDKFTVKIDE